MIMVIVYVLMAILYQLDKLIVIVIQKLQYEILMVHVNVKMIINYVLEMIILKMNVFIVQIHHLK